jgi:hypothetical protein
VRDSTATYWDGTSLFYNAVDQRRVNAMVQAGLQSLTGRNSWGDLWRALFERVRPAGYQPGQKIAIKVNLNAAESCSSHGNKIDALPQPVLALINGLVAAGVRASDVTVYDASRPIPTYLRDPILASYPNVKFLGRWCTGSAPTHGGAASLTVRFGDANNYLRDRYLVDLLYTATYLINMPILKRHTGDQGNPVTLSFKNHLGSIDRIPGSGNDHLHDYILTSGPHYRSTYSPLVDICRNPNIRDKTVLILGDGLFGGTAPGSPPRQQWNIFGGPGNSLFFGLDPVATDCVMADLIVAEGLVGRTHTYDYLFCAQEAELGTCEGSRSNPGGKPLQKPYGSGYTAIDYVRRDLSST